MQKAGMMTMLKAIDVSAVQGVIDWQKVKKAGISAAMVKASQGYSEQTVGLRLFADSKFLKNVLGAAAAGIHVGAYHYLTARNVLEAQEEAKLFLATLMPVKDKIVLWAAVDVESRFLPDDRTLLTQIVKTFCKEVEEGGFIPCIYTNPSFLRYRLGDVSDYRLWLAYWTGIDALTKAPSDSTAKAYTGQYSNVVLWQWGRYKPGAVSGISVDVDGDTVIKDIYASGSDAISLGNRVRLKSDAVYISGKPVPLWVRVLTLYVREIRGDTITVSIIKSGDITGAVNRRYIEKVK